MAHSDNINSKQLIEMAENHPHDFTMKLLINRDANRVLAILFVSDGVSPLSN